MIMLKSCTDFDYGLAELCFLSVLLLAVIDDVN